MVNEEYENLDSAGEDFDLETSEEVEMDDVEEPTSIVETFMKNFKARGGRL